MYHALPAIDADMRLHTEVPLVAFPGLVHLGVALAALVLGRRGRMNNHRVYDRPGSDADALAYRQNRNAQSAVREVRGLLASGHKDVVDADLSGTTVPDQG
ncbi:MAG: hypothetical protein JWQ49_3469 [Edaphobacter sp.]|nr:hypothetical protein [Edaphobacter sp.]